MTMITEAMETATIEDAWRLFWSAWNAASDEDRCGRGR